MLLARPTRSHRRALLVGVCLLTLGLAGTRPATATPEAAATLDGYACGQVDPELFTRQKWSERGAPYGIAFPEWDRTTFKALKRRMLACATPSNQRRTAMMLRYIDDQPYGRQAQVTQAVEALRARQARHGGRRGRRTASPMAYAPTSL